MIDSLLIFLGIEYSRTMILTSQRSWHPTWAQLVHGMELRICPSHVRISGDLRGLGCGTHILANWPSSSRGPFHALAGVWVGGTLLQMLIKT